MNKLFIAIILNRSQIVPIYICARSCGKKYLRARKILFTGTEKEKNDATRARVYTNANLVDVDEGRKIFRTMAKE